MMTKRKKRRQLPRLFQVSNRPQLNLSSIIGIAAINAIPSTSWKIWHVKNVDGNAAMPTKKSLSKRLKRPKHLRRLSESGVTWTSISWKT
jgi:hypothetical protein